MTLTLPTSHYGATLRYLGQMWTDQTLPSGWLSDAYGMAFIAASASVRGFIA